MTTRVTLQGRLAFPQLDKPERFQGQGDPRFSASVIMEPDSPSLAKARAAMLAAAEKTWPGKGQQALKSLEAATKTALINGDTKPEIAGYEGNWVVSAHAKANVPPRLVKTENGRNVTLDRETQTVIYGGCVVNMLVDFWGQDNKWGKRINAQLAGVQFVRDGDPFGGGRAAAEDDFEIIEEAEQPGFDDDSPF